MIELCSKRRMLAGVICLGGITLLVLFFESQWAFEASNYTHVNGHGVIDKNISSSDYCWVHEPISVVEDCHVCSDFEIASNSNKACIQTHFKEAVKCNKSGKVVYRSCQRVYWLEEKRFWQFESFIFVLAVTSVSCVILRQKVLDHKHLKQLQRRLANSV